MPNLPTIGRARWLGVVALLLGLWPWMLRAGWAAGEQRTAAYVGFGLEIFSEWNLGVGSDADPFGDDAPADAFPEPIRLKEKPPASRFHAEGDELWVVTAILQRLEVLGAESKGWAIYNNTTQRLVVHGSQVEHARMERFWQLVLDQTPRLLEIRTRLLKAPSRELDGVEWTGELVRGRGGEELLAMATTTRPGQKGFVSLKGSAAEGSLDVEANCSRNDEVIDLRLAYSALLKEDLRSREVRIATAITVKSGVPFYLEAGSEQDEAQTLLIELTAQGQFMDGTPRSRWREYEDPRHEPSEREAAELAEVGPQDLGDGFSRRIWLVPPTLLSDLDSGGGDAEDPDPFGADGDLLGRGRPRQYPVVESSDEVIGVVAGDVVYDISELVRECGVEVRAGGYVHFASARSLVIAKLDPANLDLVDQLLEPG